MKATKQENQHHKNQKEENISLHTKRHKANDKKRSTDKTAYANRTRQKKGEKEKHRRRCKEPNWSCEEKPSEHI